MKRAEEAAAAASRSAFPRVIDEEEEEEGECEFMLPETSHPMEEIEMLSAACEEISERLVNLLAVLQK